MGNRKTSGLTKRGGIWHIDKIVRGTRIRESTGTSEIGEAEALLARRIEEARNATLFGVRPDRTFRVAATKFLKENQHKRTIDNDAMHLKRLDPFIGHLWLRQVHMGTLQSFIDKRRSAEDGQAEVMNVIGDVQGRTCIIQDDIIDTAGTIVKAANALKANGAARVIACAVHGVLSGPAIERLEAAPIEQVVITNTIPLHSDRARGCGKIKQLSVARLLGQAIRSINEETSVSSLFV